ncbi:MAG TPA: amino acid adenylation domain-containing protein, partial [Polyangia bacterium]
ATLKAGATYVPIDAGHPPERVRMILQDATPQLLVTHRALVSTVGSAADARVGQGPSPALLVLDEEWPTIERHAPATPVGDASAGLAYILFTSGSTGRPKGVEVGRAAFSNFLRSMAHTPGLVETDRLLAITTTTFDISGLELFLPLCVGATVDIADRETAQDPRRLRERLDDGSINVLQATPATWRLLIEAGWRGGRALKMLCGGEAVSAALATELLARGKELWNMYGPTETTVWSTLKRIEPGFETITIGHAIDNTDVHIVDEGLGLVPAGIVGEIVIGGQGLARGYHGRPELTAERFVSGLRGAYSERFYRTGDLGRRLPDGDLECLGRVDHQVKIRGFRIELGEIESALRAVPGVREVLVMARADGPGDPRLVAYWVGEAGRSNLVEGARGRLPYYMQPSGYVKLEIFPLNTNGKIDRKVLPPPGDNESSPKEIVLPRSDHEARIAAIWREVLGLSQIGVDQDFFALGGTSVLAIDLRARIEKDVGIEIPLAAFFKTPSIEGLASYLGKDRHSVAPDAPIVVDLRRGTAGQPPLFCLLGVQLYQDLALALTGDRPVVGMHLPFLYLPGRDKRPTVPEMAAGYVKLIRQRQTRGPYYLAGLCFGGIVAYEAARQLEAQGDKVELVAVFDGMLPSAIQTDQIERLRNYLQSAVTQPQRIPRFVRQKLDALVARAPWLRSFLPAPPTSEVARPMDVSIDGADAEAEVRRFASTVGRIEGRLLVIRATKESQPSWVELAPHLGWQGLSPMLVARDVPATHMALMREPYVRAVAEAITAVLEKGDAPPFQGEPPKRGEAFSQ